MKDAEHPALVEHERDLLREQVAALTQLRKELELAMPAIGYGYDAARCTAAFETVHTAQAAAVQALSLLQDRTALDALLKAEREKCAVAAWNHYMDNCKRLRVNASTYEEWLCAATIRSLK